MDFALDDRGYSWTAKARLSSWAGHLDRSGPYGSEGDPSLSNGTVDIVFAPEGRDNSPLTGEELQLVHWFFENEAAVSDAVRTAVFEAYPRLTAEYGYDAEQRAVWMPPIATPDELRALIGVTTVFVHQTRNGAAPYIGFELGCTWDDEHGLGVLMHGTRVIEIGGADTAFVLWMAEQDAGSG